MSLALGWFGHDLHRLGRGVANAWFDLKEAEGRADPETLSGVFRAFGEELGRAGRAPSAALVKFACDRMDFRPLGYDGGFPALRM